MSQVLNLYMYMHVRLLEMYINMVMGYLCGAFGPLLWLLLCVSMAAVVVGQKSLCSSVHFVRYHWHPHPLVHDTVVTMRKSIEIRDLCTFTQPTHL